MAHLQDLAIDLINDVKNTKDAQSRLYLLEQVREIVIHRDKSVLAVVVKDLFDMTIDKSVQIRKFLIKFGDEVMKENAQLVFSHLLTLLNFCMFDSNENVSVMCVSLYHKYYDTLVLLIAGMEKTTDTDPKNLWSIIITLTAKVLEFLSSNRSDKLKAKSLEFCETMILFGLPTPPISSDPRLARSGRKEVLSTGKNAELIPLHHPLISRTVIEQQAEDAYSKMLLWTSKSGPQGYPFSPSLLSLLGQKIALIASQRPKHANNAAKAVTFMIQGKGNHSDKMSGSDRENLARAITRFLRTAMVLSSDSSGLMTTVQAALSYLEGLGLSGPDDTISIGKKRERDDSVPESSNQTLEEDDNEGDSRRKSAIAAVDAAEQALKRKKASMLDNRQAETGSLFHTIGDSVSSGGIARSEYTELAGEIATLPEVFNISAKLTELQPEDGQGGKNHSLEIEKSIPQEPSMYSDLSLISLKRLFDNYYEMKSLNKQANQAYKLMLARMAVFTGISELMEASHSYGSNSPLVSSNSLIQVPLLASIASDHDFKGELNTTIVYPRIQTSRNFLHSMEASNAKLSEETKEREDKAIILIKICRLFYQNSIDSEEHLSEYNLKLYDSTCIIVFTRLLHLSHLKPIGKTFVQSLPRIPSDVLKLLELMMLTGSKGSDTKSSIVQSPRNESMLMVGNILTGLDVEASQMALNSLLWQAVSTDFEIRSRFAAYLVSDLLHLDNFIFEKICYFSLHALIKLIGEDEVNFWISKVPKMALEGNQNSDSMEMEEIEKEDSEQSITFLSAMKTYDDGVSYEGIFPGKIGSVSDTPSDEDVADENYTKQMFHLFSQVCFIDSAILGVYMNIYSLSVEKVSEKKFDMLHYLRMELKNLMPVIQQRESSDKIFSIFAKNCDEYSFPFLCYCVELMTSETSSAPTADLVTAIRDFIDKREGREPIVPDVATDISVAEPVVRQQLSGITENDNFMLMVNVIGGISLPELEANLPRIIGLYKSDIESLKSVFRKLTRGRPPPMSKPSLLAYLHRMNGDDVGIKEKVILDLIAQCLKPDMEFNSEAIKNCLRMLMEDEVPARSIMRTAILAALSNGDVKRYVLGTIIPGLVKKAIWQGAPKIWEGIIVAVKKLGTSGSANSELTLRALLGAPSPQFKMLLKEDAKSSADVQQLKATLKKLLKSLSPAETEEVISGKWAGLTDSTTTDSTKRKMIDDLIAIEG